MVQEFPVTYTDTTANPCRGSKENPLLQAKSCVVYSDHSTCRTEWKEVY